MLNQVIFTFTNSISPFRSRALAEAATQDERLYPLTCKTSHFKIDFKMLKLTDSVKTDAGTLANRHLLLKSMVARLPANTEGQKEVLPCSVVPRKILKQRDAIAMP